MIYYESDSWFTDLEEYNKTTMFPVRIEDCDVYEFEHGWEIHKQIGNFSTMVFVSDNWSEIQDFLSREWAAYSEWEEIDFYNEKECQLFLSYFTTVEF